MDNHCETIIELLLGSVQDQVGDDGLRHGFMYSDPRSTRHQPSIGTQFFVSHKKLGKVALYARRHAHPYLRMIGIKDVRRLLTGFVQDNFYLIGSETFGQRIPGTYDKFVSAGAKAELAEALRQSRLFIPESHVTVFPMACIEVEADFSCGAFFFCKPSGLPQQIDDDDHEMLAPDTFPPIRLYQGRRESPTSWLGIRSPEYLVSNKMKAAILGALALAPAMNYRYMFSGKAVFGGRCTFENGWATQYSESHTPPLSESIVVREADHEWLAVLARKLNSDDAEHQREMRGLEYFYRSWTQDPPERFALLCMALDAVYDKRGRNTQAIADGVRATLGQHISEKRLFALLAVRGAVIHGRAPDVYDAQEYASYYDDYDDDPIEDLSAIAAACFRARILEDVMTEHPDPYAGMTAEMQKKGQWPIRPFVSSIFTATLPADQ